jgi:hypothetical protein
MNHVAPSRNLLGIKTMSNNTYKPSNSATDSNRPALQSANSVSTDVINSSNKPAPTNNTYSIQGDSKNLLEQKTEDLVQQFEEIGHQAQIMQGRILIELQNIAETERLDWSDFIKSHGIENSTLCALTHQHRNRLMNLAKFFTDERPMKGISATVGYEISAPKNKDVSQQAYEQAVDKNLSVQKVQELIKSLNNKKTTTAKVSYSKTVNMTDEASKVMEFINDLKAKADFNLHDALVILKTCYAKMEEEIKKQNAIDVSASVTV